MFVFVVRSTNTPYSQIKLVRTIYKIFTHIYAGMVNYIRKATGILKARPK